MHGWVAGNVATEGLATDIQGLFAFQSVHMANIGKTKVGRDTGEERGTENKPSRSLPSSLNATLPYGRGDATGISAKEKNSLKCKGQIV